MFLILKMKTKELISLDSYLFERNLLEGLEPENIVELSAEELSPFSDYYGALLGIEKFLGNKKEYGKQFGKEKFRDNYQLVIRRLLDNLFAPNHQTQRGRLNDRIRKLLQKEKVLSSSATLEELTKGLSVSREKITQLRKLGFSSSEKKKLEQEFETHLNHLINYGERLQDYLFALRPQVVGVSINVSGLLRAESGLVEALEGSLDYLSQKEHFQTVLSQLNIKGESIKEKPFFYKGKAHYSTKAFVKEWNRVIGQVEQLERIKEGKPVRKGFRMPKLKIPRLRISKKLGVVSIAALLSLGGAYIYTPSSIKYKLGLPIPVTDELEIIYEEQRVIGPLETKIGSLKVPEEISPKLKDYWLAKTQLRNIRARISSENSLPGKYHFAELLTAHKYTEPIVRAAPDASEEDILTAFFKVGYVKKGDALAFVNDYSTPKLAAQSHLCSLFEQTERTMEPEEADLFKRIRNSDVLYVGSQENDNVHFLSGDGTKIMYLLEREGAKYKVASIKMKLD